MRGGRNTAASLLTLCFFLPFTGKRTALPANAKDAGTAEKKCLLLFNVPQKSAIKDKKIGEKIRTFRNFRKPIKLSVPKKERL